MLEVWWKNAIIYAVDVERFCDSNGDGIGDFKGLASKLPYLADLGVTCLWLLPFYPSSGRDNGYDITDYLRVDSEQGQFQDFFDCVQKAGEHGIRVLVDLVAEHTSDQHPWFQAARHNDQSRYRDYYIWSQHPPPTAPGKGTMFPGQESTVWTYDGKAGAYYYHRFYKFEPTLNFRNADAREEVERMLDYWMSFGIAGFRIDAASHLEDHPLPNDPKQPELPDLPDLLGEVYRRAIETKPDAVLLGEVDEEPEKLAAFFDGTRLNMMFNFLLDNYMILALADQSAAPIRKALSLLPLPPENGQWANFLRNLDEADLERLSQEELQRTFKVFAPDEDMRLYGRGLRRRLAPMLGGDRNWLKMAFSLLFSMPGSPVICYGDEIGMGDDLRQPGRQAVRSPMQWSAESNGGFSTAAEKKLPQPMVRSGPFGFRRINVAAQHGDPDSLLSFVKQLTHLRREHREIGAGICNVLETNAGQVLAHHYKADNRPLVFLHNLKDAKVRAEVRLEPGMEKLERLLGGDGVKAGEGTLRVELEPYGLRWLGSPPGWSRAGSP